MSENKKIMHDEELSKVSGGTMTMEDEAWVDDIIWDCVEKDYSWNDVVEEWFPKLEEYCERVNANRVNTLKVFPKEIDEYMQYKFFDVGERYLRGERRPTKKKNR